MSLVQRIPRPSLPLTYLLAGAAAYATLTLLRSALEPKFTRPKTLPSPLTTTSSSPSTTTTSSLPYPLSNFIPGARDVPTPWGSLRVYEFGPETAERKVLLVHGISTPCVALAGIAEGLATRGCRVMLFDAFGRGWSDTPQVQYDEGLYTAMIFAALASSSVAWTGIGTSTDASDSGVKGVYGSFTLLGYSLGGGVAANFTACFPELVEDLVVIAPAGLIRPEHSTWRTRLLYSGLLPEALVARIVRRRLSTSPNVRTIGRNSSFPLTHAAAEEASKEKNNAEADFVTAEAAAPTTDETTNLKHLPHAFGRAIDAEAIMQWQMEHHLGFIPAFISTFRHGPITGQHEHWRAIGRRLDAQRAQNQTAPTPHGRSQDQDQDQEVMRRGLRCGKVLAVLGKQDSVVRSEEFEADAREVLGEGNLEVRWLGAGHEVPISNAGEVVEFIWGVWRRAAVV